MVRLVSANLHWTCSDQYIRSLLGDCGTRVSVPSRFEIFVVLLSHPVPTLLACDVCDHGELHEQQRLPVRFHPPRPFGRYRQRALGHDADGADPANLGCDITDLPQRSGKRNPAA